MKNHMKVLKILKVLYKSLIDSKPFHVRFNETEGFIRIYDGTKYLVLFGSEK